MHARCVIYGIGYYAVFGAKISGTECQHLYQKEAWGNQAAKHGTGLPQYGKELGNFAAVVQAHDKSYHETLVNGDVLLAIEPNVVVSLFLVRKIELYVAVEEVS